MKKKLFIVILSLFSVFNSFSEEYFLTVVFNDSNNSKNRDFFAKAVQTNGFYLKERFVPITLSQPKVKLPEMAYVYDIRVESNNIDEFVRELKESGYFEYVLLHELVSTNCGNPHPPLNDERIVNGTYSCYHLDLINARCAWSITTGNPNIIIGIVDSDFELTHEDLENQIVYISGTVSGDPHGTRVASAAAAETNNGKGIAGIGYNSKIAAYRVGSNFPLSFQLRDAIWAAYLDNRRIINVSFSGTGLTPREAETITRSGTTLTLSAGNTATSLQHELIADIPGVINVSSVSSDNNYYTGHARNQYVDLCAPGRNIAVATTGNGYTIAHGTSYAAPMVAGTVALMLSVSPSLSPAGIETILKNTAAPINNAHLYPGLIGAGRLDAYAAVQKAQCSADLFSAFGEIITTNRTVTSCSDINVYNVYIQSGKLTLDAAETTRIIRNFEVALGAELEIR